MESSSNPSDGAEKAAHVALLTIPINKKQKDSYYALMLIPVIGNIWVKVFYNFKKEIKSNHRKIELLRDLNVKVLPKEIGELVYIEASGNAKLFSETFYSLTEEDAHRFFELMICLILAESVERV